MVFEECEVIDSVVEEVSLSSDVADKASEMTRRIRYRLNFLLFLFLDFPSSVFLLAAYSVFEFHAYFVIRCV